MLRFLTTLTLTFLATPGLADTDLPDQATGAVYVLGTATADEVALTNKIDGEMDAYVLTKDCYATHPIYGLGAWQAVEGGWRIMVGGTQIVSFEGATPFDNPACVPQ